MGDVPQPGKYFQVGCIGILLLFAALMIAISYVLHTAFSELPAVNKITVCEKEEKLIVTIYDDDFNGSVYSKNLDDCR